jgi:hypothetical protein
MTSSSTAQELLDLCRGVERAHLAIADSNLIDLTGLEEAISRIAEAAKSVPLSERASVLEAMQALRKELDTLTAAIQRQHDAALAQHAAGIYGAAQSAS